MQKQVLSLSSLFFLFLLYCNKCLINFQLKVSLKQTLQYRQTLFDMNEHILRQLQGECMKEYMNEWMNSNDNNRKVM